MSVETLNETNERLIQKELMELKNQIDNKPWQVKFLRESSDKKYNIYSYTLVQGGTKWWIKKKYTEQIWAWVEWTQFTDANWKELTKDKFNAWEVVYLRVPKNKENINKPWEFTFVKKMKDKQNRNWKIYKYTLAYWWTDRWVTEQFNKKVSNVSFSDQLAAGRNFCDENWNITEKGSNADNLRFDKWETIYIRVPDRDVVDNIPEMTMDDIYKITDTELNKIFETYENDRRSPYQHADKKWDYIMVNGKKLYAEPVFWQWEVVKKEKPCVIFVASDGCQWFYMWRYDWKKFNWVSCFWWNHIDKWSWELKEIL